MRYGNYDYDPPFDPGYVEVREVPPSNSGHFVLLIVGAIVFILLGVLV